MYVFISLYNILSPIKVYLNIKLVAIVKTSILFLNKDTAHTKIVSHNKILSLNKVYFLHQNYICHKPLYQQTN